MRVLFSLGLLAMFFVTPSRAAIAMVDASCNGSPITTGFFSLMTDPTGNTSCPVGTFTNGTGGQIQNFTLTTNTTGPLTIGSITCSTTIFASCTVLNNGPVSTLVFSGLVRLSTDGAPFTFPGVPPGQDFHITLRGFQPNEFFQGQVIPEPATWLLLSSALLAFVGIRRRWRG